ncbi:hypothetical protein VNO78_02898 [Psophocarpus tetragonolobus]|uniref:Uncharacterized protein n=1 Tax=Psophocarpus tetragonolobus TaxID=3891 RepID=A0AAN9XV44_PSOTE
MEETVMEQQQPSAAAAASSGNTARSRLQKYALRSANKLKEEKSETPNCSNPSETKRGRSVGASSVSKSVSVLNFSGKDKSGSGKPPRRLSVPDKAPPTSRPKLGSITPISETRTGRSGLGQGRSKTTPISDISKTSARTKSNLLTSASYWLSQIKLSETAAKHSISLGFFKLALEAGCEPLRPLQEGLKAYVSRHQLDGLGETVNALFESYNISETMEQLQVSETISRVSEEGTRSSDDDVHSSSSTMGSRKLKPKSLNIDSTQLTPSTESTKETSKKSNPGSRLRGNLSTNTTTPRPALDIRNNRLVKKSEKPNKSEPSKEKGMVKKLAKKSDVKEVTVTTPKGNNKENMDEKTTEEISMKEMVSTIS